MGTCPGLYVTVGFMFLGRLLLLVSGISVGDFKVAAGLMLLLLASHELVRSETGGTALP